MMINNKRSIFIWLFLAFIASLGLVSKIEEKAKLIRELNQSSHPEFMKNKNWKEWINHSTRKLSMTDQQFQEKADDICKNADDEIKGYYNGSNNLNLSSISSGNQTLVTSIVIDAISGDFDLSNIQSQIPDIIKEFIIPVLGILMTFITIPLWGVFCCNCSCCNCYCYCCCRKESCKKIALAISLVFSAGVIASCFYGFSQVNNVDKGITNSICTLVQVLNTVRNGDKRGGKWKSLQGVRNTIKNITSTMNKIYIEEGDNLANKAEKLKNALGYKNTSVIGYLGVKEYIKTSFCGSDGKLRKEFVDTSSSSNTFSFLVDFCESRFNQIDLNNEIYLKAPADMLLSASDNFDTLFGKRIGCNTDSTKCCKNGPGCEGGKYEDCCLDMVKDVQSIDTPLNQFQPKVDDLTDKVISLFDKVMVYVDKYGKVAFKSIFSISLIIDVAIVFLMLLVLIFKCKAISKFFRFLIHILWNLLALMTVLGFLTGGVFTLVGTLGNEIISVISFVISPQNLNDSPAVLVDGFKGVMDECIWGNGSLTGVMSGLVGSVGAQSSEESSESSGTTGLIQNLTDKKTNLTNYRNNYDRDFKKADSLKNFRNLIISSPDGFGTSIPSYSGDSLLTTSSFFGTITSSNINQKIYYSNLPSIDISRTNNYVQYGPPASDSTFTDFNLDTDPVFDRFQKSMNQLSYATYDAFGIFISQIDDLLASFGSLGNSSGASSLFDFLNCSFIGENLKVILKYFKEAFGDAFFNVGIALTILSSCSLISIGFILFTLSIIKQKEIDEQKGGLANKELEPQQIPASSRQY